MTPSNTKQLRSFALATFALTIAAYCGYVLGSPQHPCVECCAEGQMCIPEEEWALTLIGAADDEGAAVEMSKMVHACEGQVSALQADDLPALTASALALARCRGALAECRRD